MDKRRVVVTGLGAISPVGIGVEENWSNVIAGRSGIGRVTFFDTTDFPAQIAGEVKGFDATRFISEKEVRHMDRFIQLGVVAGMEAFVDSGLKVTEANASRIGVHVGSGTGGVQTLVDTAFTIRDKGPRRVSPFYVPSSIINMIAGHLSIRYGLKGPNLAMATACSTATHAIGDAARLIEYGDADVMIAGAAEAAITESSLASFGRAKALSTRNESPETASRPWDAERDGFVLGEGAGIIVLEEMKHARRRGARIYAELAGFGLSGEAFHITSIRVRVPEYGGAERVCFGSRRGARSWKH
ncbi:beta-ketoacyl-ACP synthase II [Paraburkholderia sp. CNPSo 3281]|uniref:beta-ketoacyl-ACP synthase II n=1 Tax=unclassified Paraburkholderia TaxID=2615204 RepID=UPI0035CD3424